MEFLMRETRWEYAGDDFLALAPWSEAIDDHLSQHVSTGSSHRALLKLAALLHDIAKPETKTIDDTGRARFLGHTKRGAAVAACILGRLRFSNREIRLVEGLVYHHLRPVQMGDGQLPTQRAIYRYFRDTGEIDIDILLLALADYLASRGQIVSMEEWNGQCQAMNYILAEHERQQAKIPPVQLLDGHDIMRVFGLAPGPLIGRLLTRVHEAYASGELSTKEEALALIREELSTTDNQQAKGCHDPRDCETN
jgi:poly(A) polymerase